MKKQTMMIGVVAVVIVLFLAGCTTTTKTDTNNNNLNPPPSQTETEILIPVADVGTSAQFYTLDSGGVNIGYFAVKDSQGTVHVAFDACDVCYEAKKGYKQVGDMMQCLNCGKEFQITSIGTENTAGGCWPSYLPMQIDADNIVIKIADLEAKTFMF